MQLNVYVPREKERVVAALNETARRLGRQKNDLVIEALESYLAETRPAVGVFRLGTVQLPPCEELHLERWDRDAAAANGTGHSNPRAAPRVKAAKGAHRR